MNGIYKIYRGQLITLWVFGVLGWISAASRLGDYKMPASVPFFFWLIPLVLVFYTVGWWHNNRKQK